MPEVRLVHNFQVMPGTADEYKGLWDSEYDVINGQPGCEQWELFQSTTTPESFALLEHWQSRGAFHSYWRFRRSVPSPASTASTTRQRGSRSTGTRSTTSSTKPASGSPATVAGPTNPAPARCASSST